MTIKQRYLRVTNLLFIILVAIQFLPDHISKDAHSSNVIWFACIIEAFALVMSAVFKKKEKLNLFLDIIGITYAVVAAWTLLTAKFNILGEFLFPAPGNIIGQFISDFDKLIFNSLSSLGKIGEGYAMAAAVAIPLGLLIGWRVRVGSAATYVAKFLSAIPPIVYIPYGIALLPTFRSVSVMVMFIAAFWPIFASTMSGVLNVDKNITDAGKVLNVKGHTMLFRIILPASLPEIFIGMQQGLTVAFVLLSSAEMIGASSGLGYYIKNYSDFGDYTRTIVGIIMIGIVIVAVSFLFNRIQKYLLRWKRR